MTKIEIKIDGLHVGLWAQEARERLEVAHFAAYCMGSCHGDDSPKVEKIFRDALTDDFTFQHYQRQMKDRVWTETFKQN